MILRETGSAQSGRVIAPAMEEPRRVALSDEGLQQFHPSPPSTPAPNPVEPPA